MNNINIIFPALLIGSFTNTIFSYFNCSTILSYILISLTCCELERRYNLYSDGLNIFLDFSQKSIENMYYIKLQNLNEWSVSLREFISSKTGYALSDTLVVSKERSTNRTHDEKNVKDKDVYVPVSDQLKTTSNNLDCTLSKRVNIDDNNKCQTLL